MLIVNLILGFFSKVISSVASKWLEIQRAKESGINEQTMADKKKANEALKNWQKIDADSSESDDTAIDRLSGPRGKS